MRATRLPTHVIATIIVFAIVFLSTAAIAGGKKRPDAGPIVSGWNIDLVDIVETGLVYCATSSDPYVYAAYSSTLIVLDVSQPGNPIRVGVALLPNVCEDMEVWGDFLYCYCFHAGVQVVDVSIPTAPTIVGSIAASGDRLDADGGRLYIDKFDGINRLQVYDLSNPASPALLGTSAFALGQEFEARDGYVYATYNTGGLSVIDATNPANPVLAGNVATGSSAQNVDVAWPYAYVVNNGSTGRGLYIINVSNPAAPSQVGFYPSNPFPDIYEDVAVNGNRVYVAGPYGPLGATLDVFDVSNPAAPVKLPSVFVCPGSVDASIALNGRLAVIESDLTICVMDCSNASLPVALASYESLPNVGGLALSPTHLVMNMGEGSLAMVDRDDTQQRSFYWGNLEDYNSGDVAVKDDYAYSTNCSFVIGIGGLSVFDISDPANPTDAGAEGWGGCPYIVELGSDHAYVLGGQSLTSVDISTPTAPVVAGQVTTPTIYGFAVAEPYLYFVTSNDGLVVFDASNPAAPAPVGAGLSAATLGGQPLKIAVSNSHAFILVAGPVGGMRIVDVTNPLLPAIVGNFEMQVNWDFTSIAAHDPFAYFWTADGILRVIDVSDPTNPIEVGNIAVAIGSTLELAAPFIYTKGAGQILKFQTDLITDVDARARSPFVLGQNYPNPFNPSTSISFELSSPSQTVVEIFDVQGSLVRRLADEPMSAGGHKVEWNGRDDGGSVVGSGVYFYRLTAAGHSQAKKMVILK